jgi:tetratricopeptide (TPR) repeat protein
MNSFSVSIAALGILLNPGQTFGQGSKAQGRDSVVEATSLLGEKLLRPAPTGETRAKMEELLSAATRAFNSTPTNADSIIWLGRRTAYLGRFNEAIDIYTRGVAIHPKDARLLRHRGHRYLTTRQLDKAIADFQKAYELTRNKPDEIEPDGLPNARNIPTSSLKSNIRYHLGLAHYLKGDFEKASKLYAEDVAAARNVDTHVASAHWLYMSLRRLGKVREAEGVLIPISAKMDVIENTAYHRLLLMYKGELKPSDILPDQETPTLENVTTAYGVANWHLYDGRKDEAAKLFQQITAVKSQWTSFGYLAAEAELARQH